MAYSAQRTWSLTADRVVAAWPAGPVATTDVAQDEDGALALMRAVHCHQRSDLNAFRISVANNSGSSQAAKWPPFSTSLK